MKFILLLEELILEELHIERLKEKYVGDSQEGDKNKKIPEKVFQEIVDVSNGKFNFIAWLTVRVANGLIHTTDIYKFKDYFNIFEKNKNKFPIKDINQYKDKNQIIDFIQTCIEIREKHVTLTSNMNQNDISNYVSPNEIDKLKNAGIDYLGMSNGYQIFEIPNERKDDQNTWKVYRTILGRCQGRGDGEGIDICTIASFDHFNQYLTDYGGSYFVAFNLGDPQSPYQIHFESKQFMDRNDNSLI